jgi:hypothetical protein
MSGTLMSKEKMKHTIQNRLLAVSIASILALGLTTIAVPAAFATDNNHDNHDNGDDDNNGHDSKREFLKEVKNCFEEDNNNHDKTFSDDIKDCIQDQIDDFFNNHDNHDNHDNGDDNHNDRHDNGDDKHDD